MPGAPSALFIVPVLVQGSWVQWLLEQGPVGRLGSMRRVDFREALRMAWCFSVLGENEGLSFIPRGLLWDS